MYRQVLDPVAGSLVLSALVAAIPLVLLLVLLGVFRMRSDLAAAWSLLCALLVAVFAFRMPPVPAIAAASQGAAFGVFPIVWIIINAVWLNRLIELAGFLDVIRRTFMRVSADYRIQALIIAFCFGSLLESMAGFGAPIAVITALLMALGFPPIRAATVAMFADAAGTAFGSVGNPIVALSKATHLPTEQLGEMVGRQSAIVAFFVPFVLLLVLDGKRGLRQLWPVGSAAGLGFAIGQYVASNYIAFQLADLIGALVASGAAVILLRIWSPSATPPEDSARTPEASEGDVGDSGRDGVSTLNGAEVTYSRASTMRAFTPHLALIVLLAAVSLETPIAEFVDGRIIEFRWPAAAAITPSGTLLKSAFELDLLGATGTVLLVTGLIAMAVLRVPPRDAVREYGRAAKQIQKATVTVVVVVALAYLVHYSGQALTIGTLLAGVGPAFAGLAPILGWLGVAATGSDTSANALFGAVQVAAANHIGVSPYLLAAANSEAGALGKLISPQNLAMAAAAANMAGREGHLVRRTFGWSLGFLLGFCVLVYLMAVGPLTAMVVR